MPTLEPRQKPRPKGFALLVVGSVLLSLEILFLSVFCGYRFIRRTKWRRQQQAVLQGDVEMQRGGRVAETRGLSMTKCICWVWR